MTWVIGALAVALAIVCLWGLIAPRSQWRVLQSWSVADRFAHEPGTIAYALRRLVSGLGVLAFGTVVVLVTLPTVAEPRRVPPPSPVEQMWGSPEPRIVDRIVTPVPTASADLVEVPVLGYQGFENAVPDYVARLKDFELLGSTDIGGYVGELPPIGDSAAESADLLVNVRGAILCVPRQVVVIESAIDVRIAVLYGLPDSAGPTAESNAAECDPGAPVTSSVLIPVPLSAPLGIRPVLTLDGAEIPEVAILN